MKRKPQELFEVNLMTPVRILEESKGPDKLLTITGVAGRADVKTANGRVYTESCYIATADRAQPRLLTNKLLGQIEHPDKKPMGTLDRVCTRFTKLWVEDKELRYEAVVLPTPSGEILRGLLVGGVNVGNSTRGSGTVMKGSAYRPQDSPQIIGDIVQDDYELFGIDFVADESKCKTVGLIPAILSRIVYEENVPSSSSLTIDLCYVKLTQRLLIKEIGAIQFGCIFDVRKAHIGVVLQQKQFA